MPAHIFEFLYAYYYLKKRDGRPPSAYAVAQLLNIDFTTVLQRRDKAVAINVIVYPGWNPVGKDWAVFTDRGAEAFTAILDGTEAAVLNDMALLSSDKSIFPDNIRYEHLSKVDYSRYMQALAADDRPIESQPG